MTRLKIALAAALLLALAACGKPTKEELLQKAGEPKSKSELVARLGQPDEIGKLAVFEIWTYRGSNGSVVFTIVADNVTVIATTDKTKN